MHGWQESYSVGVPVFDRAHQQFFVFLNDFSNATRDDNSRQNVGEILNKTLSFIKLHCEAEERWLAVKRDPNLDAHKEQHRKFLVQVEGLIRDYTTGRITQSWQVSAILREWLTMHIQEIDQQYAQRYKTRATFA
jgi:hemerythrin-like metal-binding protein